MQIRELSQPVTSKKLNESIAKKFGYQLKLEQFTNEQLEDARNKLRTKISQFELSESFDSVLESTEYQKTRMFLDCINQEILERDERIEEGVCDDCGESP
jgi:ferritin-like metal-binding protein YciE